MAIIEYFDPDIEVSLCYDEDADRWFYNTPSFKTSQRKYKAWWINGYLHRLDGPAIEDDDGDKEWWVDGKYHREDGPAVEWSDGYKAWYKHGVLHREDGPAIVYSNGEKDWIVDGIELTEEEFNNR
tara:strand:- start:1 stop:378 length:378 start_codon:yes stop_codon:yes gene_type:complete